MLWRELLDCPVKCAQQTAQIFRRHFTGLLLSDGEPAFAVRDECFAKEIGMIRRNFIKSGMLTVTLAGAAGPVLSFMSDDRYIQTAGLLRDRMFRKRRIPRDVKEVVPGFLWWDAADFADYGGWALDTQFAAFMGSSYLIAHGTSAPVKDAVASCRVKTPGRYRLWVRSKNWIPEHSPGTFKVAVNGEAARGLFGTQSADGWSWQDGGEFELSAGLCTLALQDQTGFFGRCSSLILTRDLNFRPASNIDSFQKERLTLMGLPEQPSALGDYDVVVVGAGAAGCCAAIAAARTGARTLLVNDRPVLGGNSSEEIGVPINGAADHHKEFYSREGGIVEEAVQLCHANGWWHLMSRAFRLLTDAEPNLTVVNNSRVVGVRKQGDSIQSVELLDVLEGTRSVAEGLVFVDSTGDGWLGHFAGADWRQGNEARSEFGEDLAPEQSNNLSMSGCLRAPVKDYTRAIFYQSIKRDGAVPFKKPSWVYTFDSDWVRVRGSFGKFTNSLQGGTWWLEHRNSVDDFNFPEEARDELIRINVSFWNYLKNNWENRHLASDYGLDYVPFTNGRRESRRLEGDYVLNQNDLQKPVAFADAIGHCGWPMDIHAIDGIFDLRGPFFPGLGNSNEACHVPFGAQVPFRSLYSRNVDNLLMAGRNISVSRLALGSVRIQGTCSVTGQAAGTGAALCAKYELSPRDLCTSRMEELQQNLLRDDQFIPGVKNRDPADLALSADVTASSVDKPDCAPQNVINGLTRPLDGQENRWVSSAEESVPQWVMLEWDAPHNISHVQCVFDTNMKPNAWHSGPRPATCAKDYRIECRVDGVWKTAVSEQGNYRRLRRHTFPALSADAVRLTVLANNNSRCARVFEVRVY
jgi:hypothetical protein